MSIIDRANAAPAADVWKLLVCRECRWRSDGAARGESDYHAPGCSIPGEFDYEFVVPVRRAEQAEERVQGLEDEVGRLKQGMKRGLASLARAIVRGKLPGNYWTRMVYKELDEALNPPHGSGRPFPSRNP